MRLFATAGAWNVAVRRRDPAEGARRLDKSRSREARARLTRGLVACLTFLLMLGGGWLIGTKPPASTPQKSPDDISPVSTRTKLSDVNSLVRLRHKSLDLAQEPTTGWIVYELPDGLSCTYVRFDNVREWFGEPITSLCEDTVRRQTPYARGFSWGR